MPKMKYYNGSTFVTLDAANADTLDNKHASDFALATDIASVKNYLTTNITTNDPAAGISSTSYIPKMTANTTGSFVVSASGIYNGTNDAWKAFDQVNTDGDYWCGSSGVSTGWLRVKLDTAKIVVKYSIYVDSSGWYPKSWTFEGSNDGTSFTVLDTRTNVTLSASTTTNYTFTNTTPYLYYRINITVSSSSGNPPTINELGMYLGLGKTQYTIATNNAITSYAHGTKVTIQANATQVQEGLNAELQIDSLGYKKIFGTTISSGKKYDCTYDTTLDSGNGGWLATETGSKLVASYQVSTPANSFTISGLNLVPDKNYIMRVTPQNDQTSLYKWTVSQINSITPSCSFYPTGSVTATGSYLGNSLYNTTAPAYAFTYFLRFSNSLTANYKTAFFMYGAGLITYYSTCEFANTSTITSITSLTFKMESTYNFTTSTKVEIYEL